MARKNVISRSITTTAVNCLCINTETCEPENKVFLLSGVVKNDEKLLKTLRKNHETPVLKIASVVGLSESTKLYKMDEEFFITNAITE